MTARKNTSEFTHLEDAYGVSSFVHDGNGLRLLVMEKRELPVVGTMVTYHVGSRHELAGHTGATHILEHLLFKGSINFDPKNGNGIWSLLEKKGAQGNATTWCDRTNYYWVSPLPLVNDALAIEADRMRNALIRPEDLASEMTVVRNEYESGENDPMHRLGKHAWYQAFTLHPYRIPTIGTREDIEGITSEKLRKFYDTFYHPNNATVTVVGDIGTAEACEIVGREFGKMPKRDIEEPEFLAEPVQEGERRFALKRKGTVNGMMFCFKAPAGLSPDAYAVSALSVILGGGKSGLLYRTLVDTGLAVDLHIEYPRFRDPSLVEVYVALSEGVTHEKAEAAAFAVIERLKQDGPTSDELSRAIAYKTADRLFSLSTVSGTLAVVNEAVARGDWKDAFAFTDRIASVTPKDIARAAKTYLSRDALTVGYLHAT